MRRISWSPFASPSPEKGLHPTRRGGAFAAMRYDFEDAGLRLRTAQVPAENVVEDNAPRIVECASHGPKNAAYLCQHLVRGSHLGFCGPAPDADEEPSLEAWCNACDRALQSRGWVWDDVSEANLGLTLVCSDCFERSRQRNEAETRAELSDPL